MGEKSDARLSQFDYKANSNLVLRPNSNLIDRRAAGEATGEVKSLVGRVSGRMGDKAFDTKAKNKPKLYKTETSRLKQDIKKLKGQSVADVDASELLYQPKLGVTHEIYKKLLKFVKYRLDFSAQNIILHATDLVLNVMKDPEMNQEEKRQNVNGLLFTNLDEKTLEDEEFNELHNLCKAIDDYSDVGKTSQEDDLNEAVENVANPIDDEDSSEYEPIFEEDPEEDLFEDGPTIEDKEHEMSDDESSLYGKSKTESSQYKTLNLEHLANSQLKVIPEVELAQPVMKPGYQEYHIPPKKRQSRDDYLKPINELPKDAQPAFKGFKTLNLIQTRVYEKAMFSDDSLLICAPTGAGKTNVALLCMMKEILKYRMQKKEDFKLIYIAPIKALAQEMVDSFRSKLSKAPYNLVINELTGDHQLDQRQISSCHVLVCTPEKWDIVTRKGTDRQYTKVVKLVIFDEIHLLHNERGATLEALVARIKNHKYIEGECIRIVGLSATLPNYLDVARFIDCPESGIIFFDSSYRPIPMKQQYISITEKNRLKSLRLVNDILYEKVIERVGRSQILIFVHYRDDTMKTGIFLKENAFKEDKSSLFIPSGPALHERIDELDREKPFETRWKLKDLLQFGIGIHHAGMCKDDRHIVEELFRERHIKVLVCTATLAWGVNLPAQTVIIKGTQVYRPDKGRFMDLDSLDVTQMLGRAGRPQYDREGEGIVITDQSTVHFYMSLMNEQLPVESQLVAKLPDFLNAECVIGNVESTQDGVKWCSQTYLYSRMQTILDQKQKEYMSLYGIEADAKFTDPDLKRHLLNFVYTAACILDDRGLIVFDRRSGLIQSNELGRIASFYNCSCDTIKTFYDSLQPNSGDLELLRTFSIADEFRHVILRSEEALDLQQLINQVPYPIDDKYANPSANKVNALLQVYIYRRNIEGSAIVSDMHFIKDNAARLARAMLDIVLYKKYAKLAVLTLAFCKKIDKRMSLCHSPLRQFPELDEQIIKKLEGKSFTIDHLRSLDAVDLSALLREKSHKVGKKLLELLNCIPKLELDATVKPITKSSLQVNLRIKPVFTWDQNYHGSSEMFWVLLYDVTEETLLHHEQVHIRRFDRIDEDKNIKETSFFIPFIEPIHPFYFIRVISDKWFGCDQTFELALSKVKLPKEVSIITHLVDMELQTIQSLQNPLFEQIYLEKFKGATFNEIQTHAFESLYKTDNDILLLAAAGSGKKTCAELAVLRNFEKFAFGCKIAVICGNKQSAQYMFQTWTKTFPWLHSCLLSGNYRFDVTNINSPTNNIVIGDPECWNILTLPRSSKNKNILMKFKLFIINDVHHLYCDKYSSFEWICSKVKINTLARQQLIEKSDSNIDPCRVVAFGHPVLCTENLKNWYLQRDKDHQPIVYNFPPDIRPVKLNLSIVKFFQNSYTGRLISMQRPLYRLINNQSNNKSTLVFVSDSTQAQLVAERLFVYAKKDSKTFSSNPPNSADLKELEMRDLLSLGIGYIHGGMDNSDIVRVQSWFNENLISVLVATVSVCQSLSSRSYLTVIMDTQHFDGENSYDYAFSDMIQMVGLTGRPLEDHECKCYVMCQTNKAELYERLLREPVPVESRLPQNLISYINLEVASNSIKKLDEIYKPFLACSFLHKRVSKNPNYYGINDRTTDDLRNFFDRIVNQVVETLHKNQFLLRTGDSENPSLKLELLAKIALEYYLQFDTVADFYDTIKRVKSNDRLGTLSLIDLLASSVEYESLVVRNNERDFLKELRDKYRAEGTLCSPSFKAKLILLAYHSREREDIPGELINDARYIIKVAYRLLMAVVDISWIEDDFQAAETAIRLSQKLSAVKDGPNLDLDAKFVKNEKVVEVCVDVVRDTDIIAPDNVFTCHNSDHLKIRQEGWCFLIRGKSVQSKKLRHTHDSKSKTKDNDDFDKKFILFERVKAPNKGINQYKLAFELPEESEPYVYDVYFMSDYFLKSDRKIEKVVIED